MAGPVAKAGISLIEKTAKTIEERYAAEAAGETVYRGSVEANANMSRDFPGVYVARDKEVAKQWGEVSEYQLDPTKSNTLNLSLDNPEARRIVFAGSPSEDIAGLNGPEDFLKDPELFDEASANMFILPDDSTNAILKAFGYNSMQLGPKGDIYFADSLTNVTKQGTNNMAGPVAKAGLSLLEQTAKTLEERYVSEGVGALENAAVRAGTAVAEEVAPVTTSNQVSNIALGASAAVGATTVMGQSAEAQESDPFADQIRTALMEGYSAEEVQGFLTKSTKGALTPEAIVSKIKAVQSINREGADTPAEVKAMDLADKYRNVHQRYADTASYLGSIATSNVETRRQLNKDRMELNQLMATELKDKHGVNAFIRPEDGELMMLTEDGKTQPVDESTINGLMNQGFEIAGALSGAWAGAQTGMTAAKAVPSGIGKVLTVGGATVAGGALGAGLGRGADVLRNAATVKEDLDAAEVLGAMVDAGAADAVMTATGATIFKTGKTTIRGVKAGWDFMRQGNTNGAFKVLSETAGISREEAKVIVDEWEKLAQEPAPGRNVAEKAIGVATTTLPRAEGIARTAISENPQAGAKMVAAIDERAKGLHKAIEEAGPQDVATTLRTGLDAYKKDVQDFYGAVKQEATDIVDHTNYRFDFEKVGIKPVLDKIGATVDNPQVKERFVGMMNKINRLSETRTFSDLVELRQTVNDFKYNTKITRYHDKVALDSALNKIDSEIAKTAKEYMPEGGKLWMNNFKKAKTEYAKMLNLEENALVKTLNRPGITEADIQRVIPKYMNSVDSTFSNVMDKLPANARSKSEVAAVKYMADKFTSGSASDLQAVHFPQLAQELKALPLQSREAKALASTIDQFAAVFKNDESLAKLGGQFYVRGGGGNTLTDDLVMKAKYAAVGAVWRHVSKLLPTQYGRNSSLVTITSNLLDNPMKAKTVSDLMKNFSGPEAAEMRSLVQDLQVQYTKQAAKPPEDKIKLYKVTDSGKLNASNGAMGRGVYMNERVANPAVTEQGKQITRYDVNRSQLANMDTVSSIIGRPVTAKELRTIPDLQKSLSDKGFVGVADEGRVMLFDDAVIEHGTTRKEAKKWGDPTM